MSDNYRFYAQKMAELLAGRTIPNSPLRKQLNELFQFVQVCEARWAREDSTEGRI